MGLFKPAPRRGRRLVRYAWTCMHRDCGSPYGPAVHKTSVRAQEALAKHEQQHVYGAYGDDESQHGSVHPVIVQVDARGQRMYTRGENTCS